MWPGCIAPCGLVSRSHSPNGETRLFVSLTPRGCRFLTGRVAYPVASAHMGIFGGMRLTCVVRRAMFSFG